MKIVHLSSVRGPYDVAVFHKACRALVAAGHEVSYVVPANEDHVVAGVKILAIRGYRSRLCRMILTTWQAYRRAVRAAADLYHIHDPEMLYVALLLRWRGARVVYSAHEDAPRDILCKQYLRPALRPLVSRFVELIENTVCRRLSAIVAATDTIGARMRSLNPDVTVVHNYPRLDAFEHPATDRAGRPPTIAYVGALTVPRGIREILEALALLPPTLPARLVLAGTFSPPSLESEMAKLPGWQRVDWLGVVEASRVATLLASARAGIVVYHAEANHIAAEPYKLFEYMAAGIPVIASDFPHWRSIIEGARCGLLVDPRKPADIAQAITTLISDPDLADTLGRHGRSAAFSRYDGSVEVAKLADLCARLHEAPT